MLREGSQRLGWPPGGAFCYFLHDPKRVMCYGQPLRASWNQCQAMLSNAHQCKAIQPFPHVFANFLDVSMQFLLHWFFRKITRECCQAFRSLLAYRFRKALLVRLLRSRGGECERGGVEQYKTFARAHGPPPFWYPFRENGVPDSTSKNTVKKYSPHWH